MTATIISYPDNQINETINFSETLNSYELIQNLWVDVSEATTDTYIEVIYNSVTITLNITEECRYDPVNIAFINKEGGLQFLDFFKARTDRLTTTVETYEGRIGQPNVGVHQFVDYNKNGRTNFRVNSGFVQEELNETFRQLFLSERVWQFDSGIYTPLNVRGKTLEYKTRAKDRMINYEVEFEFSFNEINNV